MWTPFLTWQASGASFDIASLEVTAGDDVAFAYALVRCGTSRDLRRDPDLRLRLTIGLRKVNGRWVVTHEHHSFPHRDDGDGRDAAASAEHGIRALHRYWFDRTEAKDLDGLMSHIADDVVSYEHEEPLRYVGLDSVREVCERGLDAARGAVGWQVPDLTVVARGDLAVAWGLNRMGFEEPDGGSGESWSRGTRVFRKVDGSWVMVHQHVSYPYRPETGEVRTDLRP